jgi:hypothetical protein
VGVAREARIHRSQRAARTQQHGRAVGSLADGEADRPPEALRLRPLTLIERGKRCSIEQRGGPVDPTGGERGLCGRKHALVSMLGVWREAGGTLEQGRSRRVVTAALRPVGGALQLSRDVLVRSKRRGGAVPGRTIAIDGVVKRVNQCPVNALALGHTRVLVDRQAKQRMSELHPLADAQDALGFGRRRSVGGEAEGRRCRPQDTPRPFGLGRGKEQERLRLPGHVGDRAEELVREPVAQGQHLRQSGKPRQLLRRQLGSGLEQGQRIAFHVGNQAIADAAIERAVGGRRDQLSARFGRKSVDLNLVDPRERRARRGLVHGDDQRDGFAVDPASDERQGLGRRRIQPLRIVDRTEQRLFLGHLRHQPEDGEPDDEPILHSTFDQTEGRREAIALQRR